MAPPPDAAALPARTLRTRTAIQPAARFEPGGDPRAPGGTYAPRRKAGGARPRGRPASPSPITPPRNAAAPAARRSSDATPSPPRPNDEAARETPRVPRKRTAAGGDLSAALDEAAEQHHLSCAKVPSSPDLTVKVGDFVYVAASVGVSMDADVDEPCAICGDTEGTLLECDGCGRGFHLGCLTPPLTSIPEGEWLCDECATHGPAHVLRTCLQSAAAKRDLTVRERLLKGDVNLARVEAIWSHGSDVKFLARWFYLPHDVPGGRQSHHHPRELYLSRGHCDVNDLDIVIAHAHPRLPSDYARYNADEKDQPADRDEVGEDLFLLEYVYDEGWQRYRRINAPEDLHLGGSDDDDDDDGDGSDGDGDECDALFDPRGESRGRKAARRAKRRAAAIAAAAIGGPSGGRRVHDELAYGGIAGGAETDERHQQPAAGTDALEVARRQLGLSRLPASLPCRDAEKARLAAFVDASARGSGGAPCLYVSGVPGTGKTATTMEVLRGAKRRMDAKELPTFTLVALNGLRLASPAHLYTELHEALTGERLAPPAALEKLEKRFRGGAATGRKRRQKRRRAPESDGDDDGDSDGDGDGDSDGDGEGPGASAAAAPCATQARAGKGKRKASDTSARCVLLIVDELDVLVTRSQSVLYNLFEWPHTSGAMQPLRVIGIANTMDLPERLMPRVASRIGACRLNFTPYSDEQLQQIVRARLDGSPCFGKVALMFAAKKVAAVSGDARRALELCRRAVEVAAARADNEKREVSIGDVDAAIKELFASPQMAALRRASPLERRALAALSALQGASGLHEAPMSMMHGGVGAGASAAASSSAAVHGMHPEAQRRCLRRLAVQRLVVCSPGCTGDAGMAALNVAPGDLQRVQQGPVARNG